MQESRCLYCYQILEEGLHDFHPRCSKKIFGRTEVPILPFSESQMFDLALQVVQSSISVTGVQPKISLDIELTKKPSQSKRFTIVGLWGAYILKPPTKNYLHLPEVEDTTMHLATISKIKTVPHSLIRLQDGSLAYITKRIDRHNSEKIHMEDFCQITERLTEHKYDGSYEQIAKAILQFSIHPVLDVINFYEQVLFSFLTGNGEMHLKNFSLIKNAKPGYTVAPAYDMVASALVNPIDKEDLALTLNGKKRKVKQSDFVEAFKRAHLNEKVIAAMFNKLEKSYFKWRKYIDISFLPQEMKENYKELINKKFSQIGMVNNQ
ncbi:MAG: HipA domain-containing protein [Bacteroidetes bacterium]|nr:HipA domain-containing protein [Bacteroidota bacterium]